MIWGGYGAYGVTAAQRSVAALERVQIPLGTQKLYYSQNI
jgi:hypothetical protein